MNSTAPTNGMDAAGREEARTASALPARLNLTLRTKAILALLAMVLYVAAFALYVAHDRQKLLHIVQQQEYVYGRQQALIMVNAMIAHSIVELQYALGRQIDTWRRDNIRIDLNVIKEGLPNLRKLNPDLGGDIENFERAADGLHGDWTRDSLAALRDSEQRLNEKVESLEEKLAEQHVVLVARYREANHDIFVVWVISSALGTAFFGTIVTVFFTRLTKDIKTLESRAVSIVAGYRGPPLDVKRRDEVGGLMEAVNRMQSELRRWQEQQELSRQQRFHQEKMAAVGSLASAVAHEVNNPIAAIAGIAQHLLEVTPSADPQSEVAREHARMILAHSERIASIVRQMADVSSQRSPAPELLDLNAVVRGTCSFIIYDKRFRGIELTTNLDPALPAINAVADHLTQVLMNLLINAADAMEGLGDRPREISVSTSIEAGLVRLSVTDNGSGMKPEVLAQAFREFFTTKPADKGRGIGLFLSRLLMEEIGGRIELKSSPGAGTTATVLLPAPGGKPTAA